MKATRLLNVIIPATLLALFALAGTTLPAAEETSAPEFLWHPVAQEAERDYYVAFRGTFDLPADADVTVHVLGAAWYVVWRDGEYWTEGPPRFPVTHPEYQTVAVRLAGGRHVLAIQVHQVGCVTRLLDNPPPFLYCTVQVGGRDVPVQWNLRTANT